jgi:hypothetical protein
MANKYINLSAKERARSLALRLASILFNSRVESAHLLAVLIEFNRKNGPKSASP